MSVKKGGLSENRPYNGTVVTVLDFKTPQKTNGFVTTVKQSIAKQVHSDQEYLKKLKITKNLMVLRPLKTPTRYNASA